MNEYIDIKTASKLMDMSERRAYQLYKDGKFQGAIRAGGRIKIPRTADPRFALEVSEKLIDSGELAGVPDDKKQEAIRRLGLIKKYEKYAARFPSKKSRKYKLRPQRNATEQFAIANNISVTALYRWLARYRSQGLLGLVDIRAGGRFLTQIISEEAFELFKSMYLTQQQLSVKTCWQNICFINKDENRGWKVPSMQFMYRYIKAQIPLPVQILHREGIDAYNAKCAPYIQTDPESVEPGQVWVGDHSQLNCWVRHRNKWIRPWITAWEDKRSRAIVGTFVSAGPNQTTILQAFKRAAVKYGPPESVKIDNGRDYDSECWTGTTKARRRALRAGYLDEQMVAGIYGWMGIAVSFAIPYNPKAKPIERFFDTLDCQLVKTIPTYCGKDTARRPEELNELLKSEKTIRAAYNLTTLAEMLDKYIEAYNNTSHSGAGMNGRTPSEVLAARQSRRVLAEGVLELVARVWSRELAVGKNGVRFKGMYYGQFNTELLMQQGRKVRLSYDSDDLRQVYIYDSATLKLITTAEQNQLIQYGQAVDEENLREAMRQKSRAARIIKGFRDSSLTANMDLTSLTIKAMQEAAEQRKQETGGGRQETLQTIRPVRTPMDGQVREHERQRVIKHVRRASGAESLDVVLDMDFDLLKREPEKIDLKLFDK